MALSPRTHWKTPFRSTLKEPVALFNLLNRESDRLLILTQAVYFGPFGSEGYLMERYLVRAVADQGIKFNELKYHENQKVELQVPLFSISELAVLADGPGRRMI